MGLKWEIKGHLLLSPVQFTIFLKIQMGRDGKSDGTRTGLMNGVLVSEIIQKIESGRKWENYPHCQKSSVYLLLHGLILIQNHSKTDKSEKS